MKRVIRSSVVQAGPITKLMGGLLKSLENYLKDLDKSLNVDSKIIKESEDYIVMEIKFPADSDDQRAIRVSIQPEDSNWEYVTLSYQTDDGTIQTQEHKGVKFGNSETGGLHDEVDDAIVEAIKEFYDFDITDGNFEARVFE